MTEKCSILHMAEVQTLGGLSLFLDQKGEVMSQHSCNWLIKDLEGS